jgi:hypothetical protein
MTNLYGDCCSACYTAMRGKEMKNGGEVAGAKKLLQFRIAKTDCGSRKGFREHQDRPEGLTRFRKN